MTKLDIANWHASQAAHYESLIAKAKTTSGVTDEWGHLVRFHKAAATVLES